MLEVKRKDKESFEGLFRRFNKKLQQSRILIRNKENRFYITPESKNKKKENAISKIKNRENLLASSIGYYGDIDGMVILVFPMGIAKKACELLIGEETQDTELVLDTLAELVNIVGGKVKTLLGDHGVNVDITLPRTYPNIESLLEIAQEKKGVQVDLLFNDDKFLFFLTR